MCDTLSKLATLILKKNYAFIIILRSSWALSYRSDGKNNMNDIIKI